MSEPFLISTLAKLVGSFFEPYLNSDQLIEKVLNAAVELTQADRGSIFLSKAQGSKSFSELHSVLATGVDGQSLKVPRGQGIVGYVIEHQVPVLCNDTKTDSRFYPIIDAQTNYETKTVLCVPLRTPNGICFGAMEIINSQKGTFSHQDLQLALVVGLFAAISLAQVFRFKNLEEKSKHLALERNQRFNKVSDELMLSSRNSNLAETLSKLPAYAQSESPVLINGESGTGKELVSRFLHLKSPRSEGAFIVLNCASIPETLFEAELFGVAKGAATGTSARKGKVELAEGGTLFLDEIGEMPLSIQAKLLRVLQDKVVARVGSEEAGKVIDFRLVAATNRDLSSMVKEGKFREDLYYRLNVLSVVLPPLRERKEDIPTLLNSILAYFSKTRGWKNKKISAEALQIIECYNWPGNIRELQNRVERAIILAGDRATLELRDFDLENIIPLSSSKVIGGQEGQEKEKGSRSDLLEELLKMPMKEAKDAFEVLLIERMLRKTDGNKTLASQYLGISREGLRKALNKQQKQFNQKNQLNQLTSKKTA